ncbi:hypothetical protein MPSEU_000640800 [Mayamaea pseudoterrestris]|nr:hypothetical protein MPSEU_000640800 [Mayamaea pseudoterrestris]
MTLVRTSTLGYPRMGPNRELKFALEKFWKGQTQADDLLKVAQEIEHAAWKLQKDAGIDLITVGDHYLYDMVLAWSESLGLSPKRFEGLAPGLQRLFAMARGVDGAEALSMKKWITSNYHYMVPEFDESTKIKADFSTFLSDVERGVKFLGKETASPVVLGPVSLAYFTKMSCGDKTSLLASLIPEYTKLIAALSALGVHEVQIHEPALVFDDSELLPLFSQAYPAILSASGPRINMVSFMDDVGEKNYQWLIAQPTIKVLSLDFTRGNNLGLIKKHGFSDDKVLGAGVIDSRNVWKVQPSVVSALLTELKGLVSSELRIQPSGSMQYNPWDLECEKDILSKPVGRVLAFAKQKLSEIQILAKATNGDEQALKEHTEAWAAYKKTVVTTNGNLYSENDFQRAEQYRARRPKQLPGVALLPTTTIGSFPQTTQIRSLRTQMKKGKMTKAEYEAAIDKQIAYAIGLQEALGLDILVHGEAERTDMVEFFAQQMEGMLFTTNGWVQSFGSRCVRPPIIHMDITRPNPMTVREFKVAQDLTSKPVKGMLTGPITILNWSFPRVDISRKDQAFQLAVAIRKEIADLEAACCKVIQVDEPALREGMPLRASDRDEYLGWAVDAFRLATAGASSETQIHTHMCYCEFKDCMNAIDRLDTDVNSIENARSSNETLEAFVGINYQKGFGPGVYDIHSPVIPPVEFMENKIKSFLECLDIEQLVVNPDCGLKTRTWPETVGALKNMVEATKNVRKALGVAA